MRSGEADSYFETFKHMLEAMSSLVAPEEHADQDMREVLTSFGALMTDNTIMNSAFFLKEIVIGEKNVCRLLLKIITFYQMMKKKRLVTCIMCFVAYIFYIVSVFMQKSP